MNLLEIFLEGASRDPKKPAVIDGGASLSFRDMVRAAKGLAAILRRETRRDVAAIFLPTCREFVISYLAVLMTGKAALPFNLLLPAEDLHFIAKDAGVDVVVTSRKVLKILRCEEAVRRAVPRVLCLEDVAGSAWKKLKLVARGALFRPRFAAEGDLATLLYTSGTTGRPKGVRLTHGNLASNVRASVKASRYVHDDVGLQVLPFFHSFALTATMGVPLSVGSTSVAFARFDPEAVLDAIQERRVTYLVAIPSMCRVLNLIQKAKPRDVKSLRCTISGGEPLPADVRESFEELFGQELLEGYGLTETSPVATLNPPGANRPGSVGRPLPGVEIRIADESAGTLSWRDEPGSTGEICIRGPNVMQGYHERPKETAEVLSPDCWFRSGDIGRVDRDGYLWITGRKKEMMIVGGENVFPAEIEDCLSRHPAVAEAGVVGTPDPSYGEAPRAFVALAEGAQVSAEELSRFCRERLPLYKVPREIVFRPELPKGPTGKVMRRLLE